MWTFIEDWDLRWRWGTIAPMGKPAARLDRPPPPFPQIIPSSFGGFAFPGPVVYPRKICQNTFFLAVAGDVATCLSPPRRNKSTKRKEEQKFANMWTLPM